MENLPVRWIDEIVSPKQSKTSELFLSWFSCTDFTRASFTKPEVHSQSSCAKNWFKEQTDNQTHNRKSQPKWRQKQQEDVDRTERKRTKRGKKNQRGETHNPKAYAHADHNRKIKSDPQPDPQSKITIHSTYSPTDFIFIIFESGGKGSLFCNGKNGADFTRHNLTMHPIPMICA